MSVPASIEGGTAEDDTYYVAWLAEDGSSYGLRWPKRWHDHPQGIRRVTRVVESQMERHPPT